MTLCSAMEGDPHTERNCRAKSRCNNAFVRLVTGPLQHPQRLCGSIMHAHRVSATLVQPQKPLRGPAVARGAPVRAPAALGARPGRGRPAAGAGRSWRGPHAKRPPGCARPPAWRAAALAESYPAPKASIVGYHLNEERSASLIRDFTERCKCIMAGQVPQLVSASDACVLLADLQRVHGVPSPVGSGSVSQRVPQQVERGPRRHAALRLRLGVRQRRRTGRAACKVAAPRL